MEEAGLVARGTDADDRRVSYVHVTQPGRRRLRAVVRDESEALVERLGELDQDEVELLLKAGAVMRRLVEPEPADVRQIPRETQ
jgi:DNA-binding MarR family transcriptional regulator